MGSLSEALTTAFRLTEIASVAALALGLLSLSLWIVSPGFSFLLMQQFWLNMSPRVAAEFSFLAITLLYYNSEKKTRSGRLVLAVGAGAMCMFMTVNFLVSRSPYSESPYTYAAIFSLAAIMAFLPLASRRRSSFGNVLGASTLFLMVGFIFFLISYCHGVRSMLDGQIPCPRLSTVGAVVLLATAILCVLGPVFFPIRPFVGSSVRAALLRKSLPVTIAVILIFVCVKGSMPAVLSAPMASFLTLLISSIIVIYLVLRSAAVVGFQLEKALQESEQSYTHLVRGLKDYAVFVLDSDGDVLVWNQGAERITGYKSSEVLGQQLTDVFASSDQGIALHNALDQVRSVGTYSIEGWAGRKDLRRFWAETALSKLVDKRGVMIGVSVVLKDSTERRKAEDKMKASLLEKEVLLKEIHHRVKNNLQIISSLLRLQSETVKDKETASLFLDSQERVRAMAMVHEYLYKSSDLAKINFSAYVASLVRNLYRTFGLTSSSVNQPRLQVDDVLLSLDVAVPCGLLLTELISNAAKYAYPGTTGGPVDVTFRKLPDGLYELSVADQGVGFPENFDWLNSDSLGLRLVRLLTEQLKGEIRLESHPGIKFAITFKDDEAEKGKLSGVGENNVG